MTDDPAKTDIRPYFFDLWKKHHFHTGTLSIRSGVPEMIILKMLRYQAVQRADAEKVLLKVSTLYRQSYTLETVKIKLEDS